MRCRWKCDSRTSTPVFVPGPLVARLTCPRVQYKLRCVTQKIFVYNGPMFTSQWFALDTLKRKKKLNNHVHFTVHQYNFFCSVWLKANNTSKEEEEKNTLFCLNNILSWHQRVDVQNMLYWLKKLLFLFIYLCLFVCLFVFGI